jgi:hypothetical protein
MKVISTEHNYLVNGVHLSIGVETDIDDATAETALTLDGVKKVETEVLDVKKNKVVSPSNETQETPIL